MASEKAAVQTAGEGIKLFIAVGDPAAPLVDVDFPALHFAVFDVGQAYDFAGTAFLYDDTVVFLLL